MIIIWPKSIGDREWNVEVYMRMATIYSCLNTCPSGGGTVGISMKLGASFGVFQGSFSASYFLSAVLPLWILTLSKDKPN